MTKTEMLKHLEETINFLEKCVAIDGSEHVYQNLARVYQAAKYVSFPKPRKSSNKYMQARRLTVWPFEVGGAEQSSTGSPTEGK